MSQERKRSTSRTRVSRPTTPLRPSSRSSFRESAKGSTSGGPSFPLNAFEPAFAELSDAMSDLEANMMHFQLMHESLARFSESFASFMYGLNMNAFCVDYPEVRTMYSYASISVSRFVVLWVQLVNTSGRAPYQSRSAGQSNKRSRRQHRYLTQSLQGTPRARPHLCNWPDPRMT